LNRFEPPSPNPCPGQIRWDYGRNEIIADAVIHTIGIALGLAGAVAVTIVAAKVSGIEFMSILIYALCLVTMLALSAAYNMWPISPTKWLLRRFDHSAIYLLIAGTYTPFLAMLKSGVISLTFGIGLWVSAAIGIVLKLVMPGRLDRFAVGLCLLLGWSGMIAYDSFAATLSSAGLWLLAAGGLLYSVGAIFHLWQTLPYHNAVWHGFVLLAASCHYAAVLTRVAGNA
jgi:hemolysin III